jgi:hypothetical protein
MSNLKLNTIPLLPSEGFIRQSHLIGDRKTGQPGIIPFSPATLWRKVKIGKFPAPVKLSERITAWRVGDVRDYLKSHEESAK